MDPRTQRLLEAPLLPLILKLGAYRRNLMLSGLDKTQNEQKERGKSILYAMKMFKTEIEP